MCWRWPSPGCARPSQREGDLPNVAPLTLCDIRTMCSTFLDILKAYARSYIGYGFGATNSTTSTRASDEEAATDFFLAYAPGFQSRLSVGHQQNSFDFHSSSGRVGLEPESLPVRSRPGLVQANNELLFEILFMRIQREPPWFSIA